MTAELNCLRLFDFYHLVASDEIGVLSKVNHGLIVVRICIEVFYYSIGITFTKCLNLVFSEAEINKLSAVEIGLRCNVVFNVESLANFFEHDIYTCGKNNVVILALLEIE